jgi:CRP-like cAMP-binding protein
MIDGAPRSASVTTLRDSKLCFISQADFDAIAKSRSVPPYLRVVEARPLSPEERLKQLTRNFRRRERCI